MVRPLTCLILALSLVSAANASCPTPVLTEAAIVNANNNPIDIAAADFNHDGNIDIATPSSGLSNVLVQFGNGDGTFLSGTSYASSGSDVIGVAAGDLNGDGWADLVLANYNSNTISVLLNQQNGTFAAATTRNANANPNKVIIADMDGDTKNDVLVMGISTIEIEYGNNDGTFRTTPTILNGGPYGFAVADFNDDGKRDITSATPHVDAAKIDVFINNGDLTYTKTTYDSIGENADKMTTGDFNDDGKPDIAEANSSDKMVVLINNGNGTFAAAVPYATSGDPDAVVAADVNEDGILDLAVAGRNSGSFAVLIGNSNGTFQAAVYQPMSGGFFHVPAIISADLNNDARPDLALVESSLNKFLPLLNGCTSHYAAIALSSSANPSNYGDAVTITATLTPRGSGTPTGSVTFFDGVTNLGTSAISGATASLIVPKFTLGAHSLTATYSGDGTFGTGSTRHPFVQTVQRGPFGAPLDIVATGNSGTNVISIQWIGTLGVDHYQVDRLNNGSWMTVGTPTAESLNDGPLSPTAVYVYRVRAFDAGMSPSPFGNYDTATNYAFTVATIPAGRLISAVDLAELRTTVNALRAQDGLGSLSWTDDPANGALVKAVHINELRSAANSIRSLIGLPALSYANTVSIGSLVRAVDFQELRGAVP